MEWSRGIFVSASATDDSAIGENTSKKSGEGNNNNKNGEILQITHLQQDTARIDTGITAIKIDPNPPKNPVMYLITESIMGCSAIFSKL